MPLAGTSWVLSELNGQPVVADTTGDTIQFAPNAAMTMVACSDPEGIMEQETQYLAALQTAATYSMEGDSIQLRTADDALAVQFVSDTLLCRATRCP